MKAPVIKKTLARDKELLPLIIMHLVQSQGSYFGIDMLDEESTEVEGENEENFEIGDILWFNNVQMKKYGEGISAPTIIEHFEEVKSLESIAEQNKTWNTTLNLSTDKMINNCVCSKTNKTISDLVTATCNGSSYLLTNSTRY